MLQKTKNCLHCGQAFHPGLRHPNQQYCSNQVCQKARKAKWQKKKVKTDRDYKDNQQRSAQKWREKNPDYWSQYRQRNPETVKRNKKLQYIRNFRKREKKTSFEGIREPDPLIAKMDLVKTPLSKVIGLWYMVQVIAKMDVVNSGILEISVRYCSAIE